MRRVRCDLKDLPMHKSGRHPSCSNCRERGLKCVDEYGQVKSVKLLRRGRRLQQAEALYGKVQPGEEEDILLTGPMPPSNVTPMLKPEFFDSPFWRRLHVQRPIIEPREFCARFLSFTKGKPDALGISGRILAMALVVWAASFGFNESGQPIDSFEDQIFQYQEQKLGSHDHYDHEASARVRTERKAKTNEMLKEILYLIDVHGILRKPTWDGVRLLLMILPLTQDVQSSLERLSMYESTINLVYALSSLASVSSVNSGEGEYVDGLVRARIFWFSIIQDWMVSGLRGGRMFLTDNDLHSFEQTLPSLDQSNRRSPHYQAYAVTYRLFSIPLQLSLACRIVHGALTGPEARKRNVVDEANLQRAWQILDKAWQEIGQVRSLGIPASMLAPEEVERYIASWQIFIFECNNIIREALKERLSLPTERSASVPEHAIASLSGPSHDSHSALNKLHTIAHSKCLYLVHAVVSVIKRYLGTPFFQYDAFLVRDGVFFAGFLFASEGIGEAEDVNSCLSALREMRWAFSKSEEREHTIRVVWQAARNSRHHRAANPPMQTQFSPPYTGPVLGQQYTRPASLPRVDVAHLGTGSPAPTAATDDQWPPSAASSGGGSDGSSPSSYVAHHSPIDQTSNIQAVETTQAPFTGEGYHSQYIPNEPQTQFAQYRYTPSQSTKTTEFDTQPPALYYQTEYHPAVTPYYPDPSEETLPTPSGPLPGPSNYENPFYYSTT
jgi:hypothetical protein